MEVCGGCVWKLARRLVRNHPDKLDFIAALTLAYKGHERAAKRQDSKDARDPKPLSPSSGSCQNKAGAKCSDLTREDPCNKCACAMCAWFGFSPHTCFGTLRCSYCTTESSCTTCTLCEWVAPPPVGKFPTRSLRGRGGDARRRVGFVPHLKQKKA